MPYQVHRFGIRRTGKKKIGTAKDCRNQTSAPRLAGTGLAAQHDIADRRLAVHGTDDMPANENRLVGDIKVCGDGWDERLFFGR